MNIKPNCPRVRPVPALGLALLLLCGRALAADPPAFSPRIPDVEVVTHEGKKVHFYRDLVKGQVVAVNFIFTNCTTICPSSGALFASLQDQNERVRFISVSIDPTYDTPARLAKWSGTFRKHDGWILVTGAQSDIDQIVKAFGGPTARPQDHQPLTIVGSDATHTWTRLYGFPGTEKLNALLSSISNGESVQ
ncbi:MAG: SCO family protein [Thermoanaerobaculia bacterium]